MNINFELYRVFYTVASKGNITKASKELNISQPAISKSIKNLEDQLGGQLFVRTKRGVVLTEEGKEFYRYIEQAMEYIQNAENKFTELIHLETGCIKIGISTTLTKQFLLPFLEEFHQCYPKIGIQLITNTPSELLFKLRNGLIDIVILNLNDKNYGNDIHIIKCKKITNCFVANQSFKSLINSEISLRELNKFPLILQMKGSSAREFLDHFAQENQVILNPHIEIASYSLVVEFAKIGLGIGFATKDYVEEDLKNERLYEIKLKEKLPTRYIGIATSTKHLPQFSTKKLIEMMIGEKNEKNKEG